MGDTAIDISRLMTVREAAELLRLSPSTVYPAARLAQVSPT
jgi:hypothetical protein